MEERREGEVCPGCGDTYPLVLCAARHITREFLRDSSTEFLVGGSLAPKALFVAEIFHETRAPWVPPTVRRYPRVEGFAAVNAAVMVTVTATATFTGTGTVTIT